MWRYSVVLQWSTKDPVFFSFKRKTLKMKDSQLQATNNTQKKKQSSQSQHLKGPLVEARLRENIAYNGKNDLNTSSSGNETYTGTKRSEDRIKKKCGRGWTLVN